jgi:hypothetical protein
MDTIQLQQWRTEFNEIMSCSMPEKLQLDQLRDLHRRTGEQDDMFSEPVEEETERML